MVMSCIFIFLNGSGVKNIKVSSLLANGIVQKIWDCVEYLLKEYWREFSVVDSVLLRHHHSILLVLGFYYLYCTISLLEGMSEFFVMSHLHFQTLSSQSTTTNLLLQRLCKSVFLRCLPNFMEIPLLFWNKRKPAR